MVRKDVLLRRTNIKKNYDVTRVERKTAEFLGINSSVQKRAQNREKTTSGDY